MNYDVKRWHEFSWSIDEYEHGDYVLVDDAIAHEDAAVEQAIRDCIAAVESLPATTNVPVAHPHEGCPDPTIHMRWTPVVAVPDILTALRALQEVDTPKQELIKHINLEKQ